MAGGRHGPYYPAMIRTMALLSVFLVASGAAAQADPPAAQPPADTAEPPPAADSAPADAAASDQPTPQATFGDWSLYAFTENGNQVCYLASRLVRSSESVPRRKAAFVLITNRPTEGRKGVVSVEAGYPYQDASDVLLTVGRKQFHLFTNGGTAWADDKVDPEIVKAIHSGSTLVVTGKAQEGPTTTDTFSLKGAAPALTALDRACPLPGETPPAPVHRKRKHKG